MLLLFCSATELPNSPAVYVSRLKELTYKYLELLVSEGPMLCDSAADEQHLPGAEL